MQTSVPTTCENCNNATPSPILQTAFDELGHCLCRSCAANLKMKIEQSTWEAIQLYMTLKEKGVSAAINSQGEYQVYPSAEKEAHINISVDSRNQEPETIVPNANPKKNFQAIRKGLLTVRISNELVTADSGDTAAYINGFLNSSKKRL